MKKSVALVLFLLLWVSLTAQSNEDFFDRGIVYYLLNDIEMAKKSMNLYFSGKSEFQLKNGFMLLFQGKNWDATSAFRDYLGINHRSQVGLVGIALSTAEMKNAATIENLERTIRLNSRFSPAYTCLGHEYIKRKDFPRAEYYFDRAMKTSAVPENRILPARLFMMTDRPERALELMQPLADRHDDNFYFNLLTAQAFYHLNSLESIGRYVNMALEIKPKNPDARLLKARYLMARRDFRAAKDILLDLKFDEYHEPYTKALAMVMMALKDRKALNHLYEYFSRNKWDPDINRLLGQYFLQYKDKFNVQNWIYRCILSGVDRESLMRIFPDNYRFPEYSFLSFFQVKRIKWISETQLMAVAVSRSGDPEKIYIIDTEKMKVQQILKYQGDFQDIFVSKDLNSVIFTTVAAENERIFLYAVQKKGTRFDFRAAYGRSVNMPSALVGFSRDGSFAYITDARIASLAFESPFSAVSLYGQKRLIYPVFPFPVFRYHFDSGRFSQIQNTNQVDTLEQIPVPVIKQYALVCRAYQSDSQINKLINKGQNMDLTSSQVIKIHFNENHSAFIIYLSDLKNAFQALIYDELARRTHSIDATMFLGKERYAQLDILAFFPEKKEILIRTRDKGKNLIGFNYHNRLYLDMTKNLLDFCSNPHQKLIVTLTERSNNIHYSDTYLELFYRDPYVHQVITTRRDLSRVECCQDMSRICFTTYNGERLFMDDRNEFHYSGVSLEDALHDISPGSRKAALFVNGKLFLMDWTR